MKCVLPLLFLFACSAPVHAGVRYTLHLQTDEGGKHSEIIQNAWIQGSQAKLLFAEDFTPEYEIDADRYGANAYSVDSAHRASHLELPRHDDRAPIHIENLVTTKTTQEPGPKVLGHPTTHYVFTSSFDYYVSGGILKGAMTHEIWVANDVADPDLMTWMMFQYRLRQEHVAESLFRQVSTLAGGLPLAYDGIARISDDDGNMRIIRIGANVESLEKVNIDPSVFAATNAFEVSAAPAKH